MSTDVIWHGENLGVKDSTRCRDGINLSPHWSFSQIFLQYFQTFNRTVHLNVYSTLPSLPSHSPVSGLWSWVSISVSKRNRLVDGQFVARFVLNCCTDAAMNDACSESLCHSPGTFKVIMFHMWQILHDFLYFPCQEIAVGAEHFKILYHKESWVSVLILLL